MIWTRRLIIINVCDVKYRKSHVKNILCNKIFVFTNDPLPCTVTLIMHMILHTITSRYLSGIIPGGTELLFSLY